MVSNRYKENVIKLSTLLDLDSMVIKLMKLHEENKAKTKHPLPPIALLYTEHCIKQRRENSIVLTFPQFQELIDKQKGPKEINL